MSTMQTILRQTLAEQLRLRLRRSHVPITLALLIAMAMTVFMPVLLLGTPAVGMNSSSGTPLIAAKHALAAVHADSGKENDNRPEHIKGYSNTIVIMLGRNNILNKDIELIGYIAEQCGIAPIEPAITLTPLYAPISLWTDVRNESDEAATAEDQIAVGAYAVTPADEVAKNQMPTVEAVIDWINQSCEQIIKEIAVEPNYYFYPEGNGTYVGGPNAIAHAPDETLASFQAQWALQRVGVVDDGGTSLPSSEGNGVLIGIFDTSPFQSGGTMTIPTGNNAAPFTVTANHNFFTRAYGPLPTQGGCPSTYAEHGMYVASLAHTVARQSAITLYQTMGDCLIGDIAHLLPALKHFFQQVQNSTSKKGIINMSFGAYPQPTEVRLAQMNWGGQGGSLALQQFLKFADRHGIISVASAGNDSHDNNGNSILPPIPASWPAAFDGIVIGVAATTNDVSNGRACYSNRMDVNRYGIAAPGGGVMPKSNLPCTPAAALKLCVGQGQSTQPCVIGMTSKGTYSYLTGTSFAAPIVTGIAALIEGDRLSAASGVTQQCTPLVNVFGQVQSLQDPHLGKGIVRYRSPYFPC